MKYQLKIDDSIWLEFPEYVTYVIYAENLDNKFSNEYSSNLLHIAEQKQRHLFGENKPNTDLHIAAWREAYKKFGSKPSKFFCSVEALLSRSLKGQDLPAINFLVDLYNAISVDHLVPIGGEDWDCLDGDLILTKATGKETFVTHQNGEIVTESPNIGEIVWLDSTGVTCRRWNWRQCSRTQITNNTRNAYFVLDRLPPYKIEHLILAGEELTELLKASSPDCVINHKILCKEE